MYLVAIMDWGGGGGLEFVVAGSSLLDGSRGRVA